MSARQRMLAGELYDALAPELVYERIRARRLLAAYNATDAADREGRTRLLSELVGSLGDDVWVEPPFFCDYGAQLTLGDAAYVNANCVVLDCAAVEIGARTLLGPAVQIYTATHPVESRERAAGDEYALPVSVGRNAWIGGAAVILPGVTIGENSVVGAGSVVTRDVPANVVAAGNPCRVVRKLEAAEDVPLVVELRERRSRCDGQAVARIATSSVGDGAFVRATSCSIARASLARSR